MLLRSAGPSLNAMNYPLLARCVYRFVYLLNSFADGPWSAILCNRIQVTRFSLYLLAAMELRRAVHRVYGGVHRAPQVCRAQCRYSKVTVFSNTCCAFRVAKARTRRTQA